ncbi:hypothetical protein ACIPPS_05035 [Streptomyces sp. NPDC090127]|uniref:hypothetical protein n=1 Tax=Streptomyces sp. NPDC090127 TaxID=3365953 RepID=UPI0038161932
MATPEREHAEARMSMSELLASCAAAEAVSRPPRTPEPTPEADETGDGPEIGREAA